jgi:hypothetical protein
MNRYLQALQGLNTAALRRRFQEGARALGRTSRAACMAARSDANRQQVLMHEQLNHILLCL